MKIGQFNTTTACNVPRKLSLRDPFTGELLVDDKGDTLDFYVYGAHSDVARNAIKERTRRSTGKLSEEEQAKIGAEYLATITQGWSANIEDDNGVIEFNFKNAVKIHSEQDWIARQVLDFSNDLGNFDPKRYSKPASGSKSGPGSTVRRKGQTEAEPEQSQNQAE